MKKCTTCKEFFPISMFYKNKSRKDGIHCSCKTCSNKSAREWMAKNRERVNKSAEKFKLMRPVYARRTRIKLRGKYAAWQMAREASKKKAIPCWANQDQINEVYSKCAELSDKLGILLEVDHVVPLKSKLVCGLHVHENLQLLVPEENLKKGNRFWPNMPGEMNGADKAGEDAGMGGMAGFGANQGVLGVPKPNGAGAQGPMAPAGF